MPFFRSRMIGFMLSRFFVSSWMKKKTRSQATLGVALPILGVAIGVASFTVVLSVMGGFVGNLKSKLLGVEAHAEIVRAGAFGSFAADENLLATANSLPGVVAASPFQKGDAILQSQSRPVTAVVFGVDPRHAEAFVRYEPFFVAGSRFSEFGQKLPAESGQSSYSPAVLGSGIARALGVSVGDRVTFVSTIPEEGPFGIAPRQFPAVVKDILQSGSTRFDAKAVFVPLAFANQFFDLGEDNWAGLQVLVDDEQNIDDIVPAADQRLAVYHARFLPWTEANGALLKALRLERWGMSFVLYMVILVGCFTITITLVLSVKRKAREMAILRSIGFVRSELGWVYLLQGLLIGGVGVTLGLGVGLGLLQLLSSDLLPLVGLTYSDRPFPVLIDWQDIFTVAVGSVILSALASVWPAWEVMRINVVETLSDRG